MKIISSEIDIQAPRELVWEVLTDLDRYGEWNTFTSKVESSLQSGDPVLLTVHFAEGQKPIQQKEIILWNRPQESLAWGIKSYFPVRTERVQILTDLEGGGTRYHTYDKFWGPLVPLVMAFYRKKVQMGFDRVARDLKRRAESLAQQGG